MIPFDIKQSRRALGKKVFRFLSDKKWLKNEYVGLKKSMKEISLNLSVDFVTVRNWLIRHEIKIRGKHDWLRWEDKRKESNKKKSITQSSVKHREEQSNRMKRNYKNPVFLKNYGKGQKNKPTMPELKLQTILNNLFSNDYKYVGDFQFWLGGKNPDFMNINGQKKLIELYGDYWHRNDDPQDRIDHFKKYGFDTLVVWESELKDKDSLKLKLINFEGIK